MSDSQGARLRPLARAIAGAAAATCLALTSGVGAEPAAAPPRASTVHLDVKRHRLDNGLRVVMLVDHTTPTVAIEVVYDVGARNEERGRTGFAHLLEHMMFEGSRNVARGQHAALVSARGGQVEGASSADRTRYFDVLPANELALGLWLEADRMKWLDVSRSSLESRRAVVKEEHRQRVESAAYAPARLRLSELVFQGYWPYEHPSIGTMRDLDAAQLAGIQRFHEAYYAPNNAVLAVAGNFDEAEALALVQRHFGDAGNQADVPRYEPPPVPEQTGPRSSVIEDPHAPRAAAFLGWRIPPSHEPEHYALELAAMLLGDGESARLHRGLGGVAVAADAWTANHRGPDMLSIEVKLASDARLDPALVLIDAQLADLARVGPSEAEMKKVRSRVRARHLFGLQSNLARASYLARMELDRGNATLANAELEKYLAVTKEDVRRAVATYLTAARRNLVEVKPGGKK